jgi:hypothetical protein
MKIQYRIINKLPEECQIVVRYFTDTVTEEYLATEKDVEGNILRCKSDYPIDLRQFIKNEPTQEEIELIIKRNCNAGWFEIEELKIKSPDSIEKIKKKIESLSIKHQTLLFDDIDENTCKLNKIDIEFDQLLYMVYGMRGQIYKTSYDEAKLFILASGDTPVGVENYMKLFPGINSTDSAKEIIKKFEKSEKLINIINLERMHAKVDVRNNKTTKQWDKFYNKTKNKLNEI